MKNRLIIKKIRNNAKFKIPSWKNTSPITQTTNKCQLFMNKTIISLPLILLTLQFNLQSQIISKWKVLKFYSKRNIKLSPENHHPKESHILGLLQRLIKMIKSILLKRFWVLCAVTMSFWINIYRLPHLIVDKTFNQQIAYKRASIGKKTLKGGSHKAKNRSQAKNMKVENILKAKIFLLCNIVNTNQAWRQLGVSKIIQEEAIWI